MSTNNTKIINITVTDEATNLSVNGCTNNHQLEEVYRETNIEPVRLLVSELIKQLDNNITDMEDMEDIGNIHIDNLNIKDFYEILKVIYITNPTEKQISDIRKLISLLDDPIKIGNVICDYFGIELRKNRNNIARKIIELKSVENENGNVQNNQFDDK